jgi:hypothetical protein
MLFVHGTPPGKSRDAPGTDDDATSEQARTFTADGVIAILAVDVSDLVFSTFLGELELPIIFGDGFESGDTSAWSASVP